MQTCTFGPAENCNFKKVQVFQEICPIVLAEPSLTLNTFYLTDSYIVFTLKIESVCKITIFGLKMLVKSGLEIFFEISPCGSHFQTFSSNSFYFMERRKITNSVTKITIFPHGGKSEIFFCHMYLT